MLRFALFGSVALVAMLQACATAPGSDPARDAGQLRVAGSAGDTLLPLFASAEGALDNLPLVYDGLVRVDPAFNVVPWLARSWEISADGLTYTFHLRANLRWSDGRPLTADDQLFEYRLTTDPATGAPYRSDYDDVAGVRVPNARTIVYRLKAPNAAFLSTVVAGLAHVPLPRHAYGRVPPSRLKNFDAGSRLVVSGSYRVREWKVDDHLLLERNPRWWRGQPHIAQIYVKAYQSHAAGLLALQNGDVDTAYFLSSPMWFALEHDTRYVTIHAPSDSFNQYVFSYRNPILADLGVRKAIMYAWNRKTEAEKLFHGEEMPAVSPIPWAIKWAFDPSTERAYPYDPVRARRLLDRDGWHLGADGFRHKEGRTLRFVVARVAGSPVATDAFELLQANLKSVGIDAQSRALEFSVLINKETGGDFDLDQGGFSVGADPDPYIFLSSHAFPPRGLNYSRYADPVMDRLIDAGRRETDRAKRAAIYRALQRRFVDRLPALVDGMPYYRNVMSKRVRGFDPAVAGSDFTATMYHEPEWSIAP